MATNLAEIFETAFYHESADKARLTKEKIRGENFSRQLRSKKKTIGTGYLYIYIVRKGANGYILSRKAI